jgi:hypothetical protein
MHTLLSGDAATAAAAGTTEETRHLMYCAAAAAAACLCAARMHADALAGRHFGELSCREFRESLLAVLPQQWTR